MTLKKDGLNDADKKTTEAVSKIEEIIDQINILIINTAIEATKVDNGDSAAAVLVKEIKKLAMQTQKAAEDIEAIVFDLYSVKNKND